MAAVVLSHPRHSHPRHSPFKANAPSKPAAHNLTVQPDPYVHVHDLDDHIYDYIQSTGVGGLDNM